VSTRSRQLAVDTGLLHVKATEAVGGFRFHKCPQEMRGQRMHPLADADPQKFLRSEDERSSRKFVDVDGCRSSFKKQFWTGLNYLRNLVISLHDIALNPLLATLIQLTTSNVMMQP